jgi:phytoene synthase
MKTTLQHKKSDLIKTGSKTFHFGSLFMPVTIKDGIAKLYYFCRRGDDIVDNNEVLTDKELELKLQEFANSKDLQTFLSENNIPKQYFDDLISGFQDDIKVSRYETFEDLKNYCYKVAGTVGIMICYMINNPDKYQLDKAKKLGIALQLTNILRDVKEDAQMDRIYLAKEHLDKFNVTESQLLKGEFDENVKNLIMFYEEQAEDLYKEGLEGLKSLPIQYRYGILISGLVYKGILTKLAQNNHNPFIERVYVKTHEKIIIAVKALATNIF